MSKAKNIFTAIKECESVHFEMKIFQFSRLDSYEAAKYEIKLQRLLTEAKELTPLMSAAHEGRVTLLKLLRN